MVVQRAQENEVAGAVRDQTVVAVAGGAALDSAFTGSQTRCEHDSFGRPIFRGQPVDRGVSG